MKEALVVLDVEQVRSMIQDAVDQSIKKMMPQIVEMASRQPYLTKSEFMEMTGYSSRQVEYLKSKKKLNYVRVGRKVLFPTNETLAWIEKGRVVAKEDRLPV